MFISYEQMSKLEYSTIHACIVLKQCSNSQKLFYEPMKIIENCALLELDDQHVVPCYKHISKMPNGIETVDYSYQTMKISKGYAGLYDVVPKVLKKDDVGKFIKIEAHTYLYEGFFDNKLKLSRSFHKDLVKEIKKLSKTDNFIDEILIQKLQKLI